MKRRPKRRRVRPELVAGIAWYDAVGYERLMALADDPHELAPSFAEWEREAERAFAGLIRQGLVVYKVSIDVDALVCWCREKGSPVDCAARAEYANERIRELHEHKKQGGQP